MSSSDLHRLIKGRCLWCGLFEDFLSFFGPLDGFGGIENPEALIWPLGAIVDEELLFVNTSSNSTRYSKTCLSLDFQSLPHLQFALIREILQQLVNPDPPVLRPVDQDPCDDLKSYSRITRILSRMRPWDLTLIRDRLTDRKQVGDGSDMVRRVPTDRMPDDEEIRRFGRVSEYRRSEQVIVDDLGYLALVDISQ